MPISCVLEGWQTRERTLPDNTPFPERWIAARKVVRPTSETLASIQAALTEDNLDEARLLARLKALTAATNAGQEQ